MSQFQPFDVGAYEQRSKEGPCFVCELVAGTNPHHMIYEDQTTVAFLSKYPSLYGYTLVAPRDHREQATGDFSLDEYLALQRVIYAVAEALRHVVPTERLYILTLGGQQGNRHVHWHLAPSHRASPMSTSKPQPLLTPEVFSRLQTKTRRHLRNGFAES